jgi:membrane-associated phospholipid phosphatase
MRYLVLSLLFLLVSSTGALGDENIFNSTTAIKQELKDIKSEASDFLSTPADTENNGLIYTVAAAGATGLTFAFDNNIRDMLQGSKSKTLDKATNIGNTIGNPFVHIGIAAVLYGGGILADSPKYKEEGQMLGEALFLSDASTFILGNAIGRGRPYATNSKGDFKPFQFNSNFDSMPSMHTSSAFATASILSATTDSTPAKILYYAAATFVGFSRIYSDKHWASDVVLGAAIGELSGIVVMKYHSSKRSVAVMPSFTGKTAELMVMGTW